MDLVACRILVRVAVSGGGLWMGLHTRISMSLWDVFSGGFARGADVDVLLGEDGNVF